MREDDIWELKRKLNELERRLENLVMIVTGLDTQQVAPSSSSSHDHHVPIHGPADCRPGFS